MYESINKRRTLTNEQTNEWINEWTSGWV